MPTWESAAKLVRTIAHNYKLPYYTISPTYSICAKHGYLDGEQSVCPICGEEAEIYSRITGYYRPVKNWNIGKSQEYKNRTTYKPMKYDRFNMNTVKEDTTVCCEPEAEATDSHVSELVGDGLYLFTTKTCPNCKLAKQYLDGLEYTVIDAEENPDMAREFGIMSAPTLVVMQNGKRTKYANASNIKRYAEI